MPYFYDFFTEIAEGYGKGLDNEILIAILENLGVKNNDKPIWDLVEAKKYYN